MSKIIELKKNNLQVADDLIIKSYEVTEPTKTKIITLYHEDNQTGYYLISNNGLCEANHLDVDYGYFKPITASEIPLTALKNMVLDDLFLKVIKLLEFNTKEAKKETKELEAIKLKLESLKDSN